MVPGLGQLVKGQIIPGLLWAILTGSAYFAFFWPGLVIHVACILDAAFNKGPDSWIGLKSTSQRLIITGLVTAMLLYLLVRTFEIV